MSIWKGEGRKAIKIGDAYFDPEEVQIITFQTNRDTHDKNFILHFRNSAHWIALSEKYEDELKVHFPLLEV